MCRPHLLFSPCTPWHHLPRIFQVRCKPQFWSCLVVACWRGHRPCGCCLDSPWEEIFKMNILSFMNNDSYLIIVVKFTSCFDPGVSFAPAQDISDLLPPPASITWIRWSGYFFFNLGWLVRMMYWGVGSYVDLELGLLGPGILNNKYSSVSVFTDHFWNKTRKDSFLISLATASLILSLHSANKSTKIRLYCRKK